MKKTSCGLLVLFALINPAQAQDPATVTVLATLMAEKIVECTFHWDDKTAFEQAGCGPINDFMIKPELKRAWTAEHLWRVHCGEIATKYCKARGLPGTCQEGIELTHKGKHPECDAPSLAAWCGSIAANYCMSNGMPDTCGEGIEHVHSGQHKECDF